MYERHYDNPKAAIGGMIGVNIASGIAISRFAEQEQTIGACSQEQPQLAIAVERLHYCIQELRSAMGAMSARLDPVLNPDLRTKSAGNGIERVDAPSPVRSPLAACIDSRSDDVCEITIELRMLLDRLAC